MRAPFFEDMPSHVYKRWNRLILQCQFVPNPSQASESERISMGSVMSLSLSTIRTACPGQ
jgi:hypothetical protein